MDKIVVLGAGYAGLLSAVRLARKTRGRAQVTLVNGASTFVERIRLHQVACDQPPAPRPIAPFLAGTGVELIVAQARSIDPERKQLQLDDGRTLGWDRLVLALGSRVDPACVPGARENVFTLDAAPAEALRRALPSVAAQNGRVVVVGGGLTGIEIATELAERWPALAITLVTSARVGDELSRKARQVLLDELQRRNIALVEETQVRSVQNGVLVAGERRLGFEVCVWAGGFVASPLAREAGLAVNERGQALVDAMLRSVSHPDIYAVGDAAALTVDAGAPLHMACKTAMPMGAHAADNLAARLTGRPERAFRFGDTGVCISLGRARGLIQLRRTDGSNRERVITGRLGAYVKELVCRYTTNALWLEARGLFHYRWLKGAAPHALPANEQKRLAA
jgi:NADH dehydrogenase FAD-containing subunit